MLRASRELHATSLNEVEKSHIWLKHGSAQYAGTDVTLKSTILSPEDNNEGKSSQWGELQVAHLLATSAWRGTVGAQIHSDNEQLLRILLAVEGLGRKW